MFIWEQKAARQSDHTSNYEVIDTRLYGYEVTVKGKSRRVFVRGGFAHREMLFADGRVLNRQLEAAEFDHAGPEAPVVMRLPI